MKKLTGGRQTTIQDDIVLSGIGVHSGKEASVILHPAEANTGWVFLVPNDAGRFSRIPADFRWVSNVTLCTVLSDGKGASVSTVEHLLAALRGMGVDNVEIEIEGGELPILDGSAAPFVEAIDEVGLTVLDEARRYIKILRPIRFEEGLSVAEFRPYDGCRFDVEIDFDTPVIGRQQMAFDLTPHAFRREISRARTFGFMRDVERLWAVGRALGSSLENSVAIGEDRILNPEGLRFADEFVRHKTLDAVGDIALAGAPILGAFRSVRGGHRVNTLMVKTLYENRSAWTYVEAELPRYRESGHADIGAVLAQPAFAAERA
jgi:UDP-3-O-[3-hydroxymyristoyl] N-acetylglucosamine deacetylase